MNKFRLIIFSLFAFSFTSIKAETINISGQITDGPGIIDLYVSFGNFLDTTVVNFVTDENGAFSFSVEDLAAQGYFTLSFVNCTGAYISAGGYWSPENTDFAFTFEFCPEEEEEDTCNAYFAVNYEQSEEESFVIYVDNLSTGNELTYFWSFGDGTGSNEEAPTHYYNSTGTWILCLTVDGSDGCTSTFCDSLNVDDEGNVFEGGLVQTGFTLIVNGVGSVGVSDQKETNELALYPSPMGNNSILNIQNSQDWSGQIEIVNAFGQIVFTSSMKTYSAMTKVEVNMEGMDKGIYFVRLTDHFGNQTSRSIVK